MANVFAAHGTTQRRPDKRAKFVTATNDGADLYPTEPRATLALLKVEPFSGLIWEPACGDGAIARLLEAAGHAVRATDLNDWGYGKPGMDFLTTRSNPVANIVTNPPYNISRAFIYVAMGLFRNKMCLLLPFNNLAKPGLREALEDPSFARVWLFSPRLSNPGQLDDKGRPKVSVYDSAWFVWDRAKPANKSPELGWLRTKKSKHSNGFFKL